MIKNIIDLLALHEYYGISERVEIAKGKYSIAYTWKDGFIKIKRLWLRKGSK